MEALGPSSMTRPSGSYGSSWDNTGLLGPATTKRTERGEETRDEGTSQDQLADRVNLGFVDCLVLMVSASPGVLLAHSREVLNDDGRTIEPDNEMDKKERDSGEPFSS
ncbi:hypothetical protein NCU16567 [Neurospora crassa OR74A]|uniref:Uncharacterized protein n=1 Tax=Neurospora crassa (strain ATCC 24698 / 74-OR23-1A / CBS 708.71 / DSM 1257 / FGSC 987) TaxID=367110 RepID=V5IQ60_NEUCR|nr:hypothetical protein NCU16567 [Neurospora crassa OR74A]ESA43664.1 hypothetical protein NCU16567 [Neurospora crassa OR74A]|eukprot:XP_011393702.1 hypothetical protein NCU16567 [Neurospora crassa OR74A]